MKIINNSEGQGMQPFLEHLDCSRLLHLYLAYRGG